MSSKMEQIIEEIEEYIDGCKFQPLSSTKIIVNKEELEELQDNMKVDTDLDSNMYKAGPFTLNYVYGFNSEIKALTEEQKNDPIK